MALAGRGSGGSNAKATGLVNDRPLAATAGNAILATGGNVVDAIVGAALAAGVVAVQGTGIGGYGGHLVLARPGRPVNAIDFSSAAPATLTPNFYRADDAGAVNDNINIGAVFKESP